MISASEKPDNPESTSLGRRSALVLGALSVTALFGPLEEAARAQGGGGVKLTILIAPPKDPAAFTKYYLDTHIPLVAKTPGVKRVEVATVLPPPPPQPAPPYYRITEIYFEDLGAFQTALASPEWKAIVADVPNFADPSSLTGFASAMEGSNGSWRNGAMKLIRWKALRLISSNELVSRTIPARALQLSSLRCCRGFRFNAQGGENASATFAHRYRP